MWLTTYLVVLAVLLAGLYFHPTMYREEKFDILLPILLWPVSILIILTLLTTALVLIFFRGIGEKGQNLCLQNPKDNDNGL